MRRLSGLARWVTRGPRRPTDERGAVAVVVALLMVPLIGFAAISIDVAAMWAERQELQTGADAGALAVAQDCARDACGNATGTAQTLAVANVTDGGVTASVDGSGAQQVKVTTSGVRQHLFAPVLGINSSTIVAHSRAGWGAPTAGTAELPLAVSWCDFQAQTGGGPPTGRAASTLLLSSAARAGSSGADTQPSTGVSPDPFTGPATPDPTTADPATSEPVSGGSADPTTTSCTGPRGNDVPTGFGWLDGDHGTCRSTSSIAGGGRSAGASPPGACSSDDFQQPASASVMLPIFDEHTGPLGGGHYRIYGYAAFVITGYHFAGRLDAGSPCTGSESCVSGYFTRSVDLSDRFSYAADAPRLGASVVSLTQ